MSFAFPPFFNKQWRWKNSKNEVHIQYAEVKSFLPSLAPGEEGAIGHKSFSPQENYKEIMANNLKGTRNLVLSYCLIFFLMRTQTCLGKP